MTLSFVLCAIVGLVYQHTHRGISYTQSYVQTLVFMGMIVALVMLIIGSNIARAFALVGALSIIRFRNAVKETRDVGFIFFAMAIGMAAGTRFYSLAIIATAAISGAILLMERLDWFKVNLQSQVLKVQVPAGVDFTRAIDDALLRYTDHSELVSLESVRAGALTEMTYTARLKQTTKPGELIQAFRELTGGQKVTLLTGYDRTDL
ncbi:MAG TPA: DUF4956 domain-containing protein [Candidatus Limnocylindria bacterium]|nr:DUF4956 domain-containing protein [Candidatus Limnocylindria bacterium]